MGIFMGKEQLLDRKSNLQRISRNEAKGLEGEINVGELLAAHLPYDTYIISHPANW
ncbi:hypothetical protein QGM71_07745 [Virgibacillus sp. C22-A2]|uniref:Uncharacterized protein n=1 Tax=Virgibacillus tibetensis TaxID=3042313 RepID=A0ABU6KDI1_9BACI|nr:hypothetical protein [Virgibacillus sp. C22-A2]